MSHSEFDLIARYFIARTPARPDVVLGAGDDCALLQVPLQHELAVSIDTLVSGVHFLEDTSPADIGYRSLATSLSDLAAMGAEPAWVTAALTLPVANESWLAAFCEGFFELINHYKLQLVGGDLTHGPLSISVQVHGFVPRGKALRRDGARVGDRIYVTGTLGDAGQALRLLQAGNIPSKFLSQRFNRPQPHLAEGVALRDIAHSAIDISDGLAADLGHILEKSNVGATIWVEDLPLSADVQSSLTLEEAYCLALSAGDDYELCFTAPADKVNQLAFKCTCVGIIEQQPGLRLQYANGKRFVLKNKGYAHF